jgi:hypothetical protein
MWDGVGLLVADPEASGDPATPAIAQLARLADAYPYTNTNTN